MKKKYEQPQMLIIMVEQADLLLISTPVGEDAQGPARIREYEEEYEW